LHTLYNGFLAWVLLLGPYEAKNIEGNDMTRSRALAAAVLAALGLGAQAADAGVLACTGTDICIGLQEATVNSGHITLEAASPGFAFFDGNYGTFKQSSPAIGVGVNGFVAGPGPALDTNSVNVSSSTAGTLTIYVTERGLTSPSGINYFISSFTTNLLSQGWTVEESTYVDTADGLYNVSKTGLDPTATLLGSHTFPAIGTSTSINASPSLSSPYSETAVFTIKATGKGQDNSTIDIAVPEPESLALAGMAMFGFGLALARRRR
jgi:PEP-CTERM motif-containing protein